MTFSRGFRDGTTPPLVWPRVLRNLRLVRCSNNAVDIHCRASWQLLRVRALLWTDFSPPLTTVQRSARFDSASCAAAAEDPRRHLIAPHKRDCIWPSRSAPCSLWSTCC